MDKVMLNEVLSDETLHALTDIVCDSVEKLLDEVFAEMLIEAAHGDKNEALCIEKVKEYRDRVVKRLRG